jgi:hypothetical protein
LIQRVAKRATSIGARTLVFRRFWKYRKDAASSFSVQAATCGRLLFSLQLAQVKIGLALQQTSHRVPLHPELRSRMI